MAYHLIICQSTFDSRQNARCNASAVQRDFLRLCRHAAQIRPQTSDIRDVLLYGIYGASLKFSINSLSDIFSGWVSIRDTIDQARILDNLCKAQGLVDRLIGLPEAYTHQAAGKRHPDGIDTYLYNITWRRRRSPSIEVCGLSFISAAIWFGKYAWCKEWQVRKASCTVSILSSSMTCLVPSSTLRLYWKEKMSARGSCWMPLRWYAPCIFWANARTCESRYIVIQHREKWAYNSSSPAWIESLSLITSKLCGDARSLTSRQSHLSLKSLHWSGSAVNYNYTNQESTDHGDLFWFIKWLLFDPCTR